MHIFLDESYNLKDRSKLQFISINGFKTVDMRKLWKRWKEYRLPFIGKSRIHASDRLFEPLRAKCLKLFNVHPDITLFTATQEIHMIPVKGDAVYYDKKGKLLFDNVYVNILKELLKEMNLHAYKEVSIIVDSRKHKRGVLGKKEFQGNIKHFLKNWYPNTISNFNMQPSTSNILLEMADFVSNSFYRQYLGQEILLLELLEGKTLKLNNPLGRGLFVNADRDCPAITRILPKAEVPSRGLYPKDLFCYQYSNNKIFVNIFIYIPCNSQIVLRLNNNLFQPPMPDQLPKVSIIIPTKNSIHLDACLESIKNQTYQNIEIIVVDNNSTDNTKDIARKHTDKVFNKGPERSAQRNFGAQHASGEYLLVVDCDMQLTPRVVESCVEKISHPVGAGLAPAHDRDQSVPLALTIPERSIGTGLWSACKALERSFYVGVDWMEAARFFDRKIFDEMNGYDEHNTGTEDYDLPQRIRAKYGDLAVSRIDEFILHQEGRISLKKTCTKKFYYAQKLDTYKKVEANQTNFQKQSSIFARYCLFFSHPLKLFRNPFLGLAMLFMKTCEFVSGGVGYILCKTQLKQK